MHTVVRIYSGKGAAETIDLIIAKKRDVKKIMHAVKGFVDYSMVKTEAVVSPLRSRKTKRHRKRLPRQHGNGFPQTRLI